MITSDQNYSMRTLVCRILNWILTMFGCLLKITTKKYVLKLINYWGKNIQTMREITFHILNILGRSWKRNARDLIVCKYWLNVMIESTGINLEKYGRSFKFMIAFGHIQNFLGRTISFLVKILFPTNDMTQAPSINSKSLTIYLSIDLDIC